MLCLQVQGDAAQRTWYCWLSICVEQSIPDSQQP
jgi:hypothetical protein